MTRPQERFVSVAGCRCRIWEMGTGSKVGFLAGFRGTPSWTPFLDRLADHHRVVVPSLPGFPGSEPGHRELDDTIDWITMALDLLEASDLCGSDLVAESIGAMLAFEAAAVTPGAVRRLAAIGPLGLYAADDPVRNPYQSHMPDIPGLLCRDPKAYTSAFAARGRDAEALAEHEIEAVRADEAAARLIWPFGDRGLAKRLRRVTAPVFLVWGADDAIVPPSYARRFAARLARCSSEIIAGAGHLASVDAPVAVAGAVSRFFSAADPAPGPAAASR